MREAKKYNREQLRPVRRIFPAAHSIRILTPSPPESLQILVVSKSDQAQRHSLELPLSASSSERVLIEALHVTDRLRNISVACNTLSVQSTIFYATYMAISIRKYYSILKATDGDPPGIKFA
jgi:hypothetical protein